MKYNNSDEGAPILTDEVLEKHMREDAITGVILKRKGAYKGRLSVEETRWQVNQITSEGITQTKAVPFSKEEVDDLATILPAKKI